MHGCPKVMVKADPATDDVPPGAGKSMSPWRLAPLAAIGAGLAMFLALGLNDYLSFEMLRDHRQTLLDWRRDHFALAMLSYAVLYGLVVAFSLPGAMWMTIAGGFLFGVVNGGACAVIGSTAGAVALFVVARYALADVFHAKAGAAALRMEAGFRENALSYLLVLRLIPLFPFWLVNLVPAVLGIRLHVFFVGTLFGVIPGTIVYASVGAGVGSVIDAGKMPDLGIIFEPEILLPLCGLAVLSLLPIAYKKLRRSA